MREILFRAKRIDNDEYVKGYYVHLWSFKKKQKSSNRIYSGYAETDCDDFYPDWFEVDPSTVGQFTSWLDIDEDYIFEGDIVEWTNEHGEQKQGTVVIYNGTTIVKDSTSMYKYNLEDLVENYEVLITGINEDFRKLSMW